MPPQWTDPKIWDNAAAQYNDAVVHSSRIGAIHLIEMANELSPLSAPDAHAIDLGAGTGSLTHLLAASYPTIPILGTDISPGMLETLISLDKNQNGKITTQVVDMASPIGGQASEGKFSHVFSTMAIQVLPDPTFEGTLAQWARLLKQDGVIAIGIWDFDENCGPHVIWNEAAKAVNPDYISPANLPPRAWSGRADLEKGLKSAGFLDVKSEVLNLGFNVGTEGFLKFFFESGNPMTVQRRESFKGELGRVRIEMERLLNENFDKGTNIPLSAALAVGKKPNSE